MSDPMSRETFLTRHDENMGEGTFDSVAWALSEHVNAPDTGAFNSAVLHGNEDAPEMIDFYTQAQPLIADKRAYRWVRATPPDYVEVS